MAPATVKRTWVFKQGAGYFCPILNKFGFSRKVFPKSLPISNFTGICPVGAALMHTDRQTGGWADEQPDNISPEDSAFMPN